MNEKTYIEGFHIKESVSKMTYNDLGKTELRVSAMSLGGCPFGVQYEEVTYEEGVQIVVEAIKNGVNFIDTSPWYGQGRSETIIGLGLKQVPRKAYYVGTKVGRYELNKEKMFDFSKKKTMESVDTSLKLLGLEYLDLVQVHDVEFCNDINQIIRETLPTLLQLKKEGKIRYIGITGYPLCVLKEIVTRSTIKIDLVLSYCRNTLIDDSLRDYITFFKENDVGVINAGATCMGLFTVKAPPSWHPATEEIKDAAKNAVLYVQKTYPKLNISRLSALYSFEAKGISTHVFGSGSIKILGENLQTVFQEATDLELKAIQDIRKRFFLSLTQRHWEGNQNLEECHKIQQERLPN